MYYGVFLWSWRTPLRGGSRTAATSKMERFVIIVNDYHKALHLGCCSNPRFASASEPDVFITEFKN